MLDVYVHIFLMPINIYMVDIAVFMDFIYIPN